MLDPEEVVAAWDCGGDGVAVCFFGFVSASFGLGGVGGSYGIAAMLKIRLQERLDRDLES